jgi:hypothetical protein
MSAITITSAAGPFANTSFRHEITMAASSSFYRMEARDRNERMIALTIADRGGNLASSISDFR